MALLCGRSCGAAAHSPFNLPGCLNVADKEGFEFCKEHQVEMCGGDAEVDIFGDAADIPLLSHTLDYVISSHMIEHHPDPIGVFLEWQRLLHTDGVIFKIFPKRDALPEDKARPISDIDEMSCAHQNGLTVATAPEPAGQGKGGHYYVYTLQSMKLLIDCAAVFGLRWELMYERETDDKVGNGHLLVYRQLPEPYPHPVSY